jgi:hypothetical protein
MYAGGETNNCHCLCSIDARIWTAQAYIHIKFFLGRVMWDRSEPPQPQAHLPVSHLIEGIGNLHDMKILQPAKKSKTDYIVEYSITSRLRY